MFYKLQINNKQGLRLCQTQFNLTLQDVVALMIQLKGGFTMLNKTTLFNITSNSQESYKEDLKFGIWKKTSS